MSGIAGPSSATNIWFPTSGSAGQGGVNPSGLSTNNNLNVPLNTLLNQSNSAPPIPRAPTTPFPAISQPVGGLNNYNLASNVPGYNPNPATAIQNAAQVMQNATTQRRLVQLEEENARRRNTTLTLQQMGTHLLQDQMNVQEQVLQYQFMLEQCLETLDHQNFVLNGQAEELALLRAKLRTFEAFMDTIKQSQDTNRLGKSSSIDSKFVDGSFLCSKNLIKSLNVTPGSPFSPGGVTRITSSKFQPFNPRYRSPNSRTTNLQSSTPNSSNNNTRVLRSTNSFRN